MTLATQFVDRIMSQAIPFVVRHFRPVDRSAVRELVATRRSGSEANELAGITRHKQWSTSRDVLFHSFLAVDGARVLGGVWLIEAVKRAELIDLIVDPAATRQGIGAALLREALLIADSHRLPFVSFVRETDLVGLKWLSERGFWAGKLAREHFRECDAVVMERAASGAAPRVRIAD